MADHKYTSSYQKKWEAPIINKAPICGHNQSFDPRTASGGNNETSHVSLHQDSTASGRAHMTKPSGIVTRSKHALHLPPQGEDGSIASNGHRNHERLSHDQRKTPESLAEIKEKTPKHIMNICHTVCTEPGKCQGGGELRLSHLSEQASGIEVPSCYALVGCKSPLLPGLMLVAAVDKRYLPDEETSTTMLGFSGNCIGCGAKGFRYFTEFSQHINLRLATQPKKQKHMKYYIVKDYNGRLRKGNLIPWRVEGRKRSIPMSGSFVAPMDDDIPNTQSAASMASGPPLLSHPTQQGSNAIDISPSSNYQSQSYSSQPSAKRYRWESGSDNEAGYAHESENSPLSSAAQDSLRVELPNKPWLTAACGVCPVLLLCQHSIPNVPCSLDDIIVSDLLVGCFDPPLVSDHNQFGSFTGAYAVTDPYSHHGRSSMGSRYYQSQSPNALTTQMAILLLIQHLSQFDEDDRIMREEVESLLQDAQLELSTGYQHSLVLAQSNLLTHVQLPVLANLAAVSSKGRVKVVTSPVSLDNAIVRGLKFIMDIIKHNQNKFPKVPMPDYIFMLSTSQKKAPEFCFLVSGVHQARYLTEAMIGHPVGPRITDNLSKLEQLFRLSSDALEQMVNSYEEAMGHAQLVFIPFNGFARMKVMEEEALKMEPKVRVTSFQHYGQKANVVYTTQNQIAKQLVAQVCSIAENSNALDINKFIKVDLAVVVPPIATLFNQTIQKLANSGILADLDLEEVKESFGFEASFDYVIKHDDSDTTQEKLAKFLKKVQTQPSTLFILIFDQAQFYSSPRGVLDLPFYKEFLEASNVIPLFVTSAPYLFQTNCSFIDPENEVYWTDSKSDSDSSSVTSISFDDDQYVDDQDSMYFGLKEYCDSIKWTHQFPLFRQDDAFERMALRTTRVTDDVNVSVLRCYLLIRHYCAAIMWSAGIKPAEPHCTLKTIQIIREIIESPVRNADGSGSMLVIRIPSAELAVLAFDSLKNVRDRLGFQYRFAVIHDNGMGELEIEDYFLKRLRFWKKQRGLLDEKLIEDWHPKCYEELLDLPCIILLSGRERTGETFPRSLKYIDIRLIDRGFLYRSSLELEFSAIACYISTGAGSRSGAVESGSDAVMGDGEENKDDSSTSSAPAKTSHYSSNYPLPVILVSRSAFKAFQTDFYGYPKHLLLPTTPQTRWTGHGRPHLVTSNPANQSLYYRKWTEPKPSNLVGTQCRSVNSRTVINMRSASGIVISPDIPDVVEEDGMSAVETMCETPRQPSVAGSETEDNGGEDSKPNSPGTKPNTADDREPAKPARIAHHQRAVPKAPSVASESDNETPAAVTTDDESDGENAALARYHPRSILFSGLPQVGKTGAYLHFARLLHRMLIKQQKVDVYDEIPAQTVNGSSAMKGARKPDFNSISKLPFNCELNEYQYSNISSLSLFPNEAGNPGVKENKTMPPTQPVTSILLSPWAAYDICHHCDSCKPYRDGIGPNASLYYTYRLKSGEKLHFLIPPSRMSAFSFTDDKKLHSLKLPKVLTKGVNGEVAAVKKEGDTVKNAVKTPVMIPSTRRCDTALLNLYHAFEGESHTLLVFTKQQEMSVYAKMWPNHVIVGRPKESEQEGIGTARYFIKQFATENFLVERERQGVDGSGMEDIWPMVLMMDDSCALWKNLLRVETRDKEEATPFNPNTSLLKILEIVESTPDILKYGTIGFRQFSSKDTHYDEPSFSHCCLNTAVILNVAVLQDFQYSRYRYSCEDLNFSLLLYSRGIPSCRLDHLTVAKKRIEVTCKPTVKLLVNTSESSSNGNNSKPTTVDVNDYSNYVTAPDSEDTHHFSAPAEYLLEKYLVEAAARKLFQTAADNPHHPILAIDNYVNLGPRFTVEYVSTSRLQQDGKPGAKGFEKSKTKYGGLLLFYSDQAVSKELLQGFDFIDDAQLCLVCQDRNILRQEVVRLDLEEQWRFRLRDELQTANDPEDPSLFILTGKHD